MWFSVLRLRVGLAFGLLALGVALIVAGVGGSAAVGAGQAPLITDRLHHISGVVAVPPQSMMGQAKQGESVLHELARLLTPPEWGPNVDAALNNISAQNETTIAINPEDNQRVIASANDYRANLQPWVYLSTNGGAAWTNYQVPGSSNSLFYGDPAMAFGTGGYAYFAYLGYQGICSAPGGMYVSRSTDAATTFSTPIRQAQNSNNGQVAVLEDKEYIAVDNNPGSPYFGNVYEGWTKFVFRSVSGCGDPSTQIEAPVVLSRSTDHGVSWTVPITASQPYSNNNQGTVPVIGRHGEVYLYYLGAQTQTQFNYDTVLFSRSTDGGQTFPFFTHVASVVDLPSPLPHTNFRNNPFGAMAADQQVDGYLYAVWADYRTGDADIMLARSTDNGDTWSPPQRLNDDAAGNGKDQFFPWIAASPDGYVHVAWFDRREDPNDANYKEYYTYSSDHGATWAANVAVSSAPSVPGSSGFIGDYSGIAATNGIVMPVWTDIRSDGNQNAYTARGEYTLEGTPTLTPGASSTPTATGTNTATRTETGTATSTPMANTATGTSTASATTAANTPTRTQTAGVTMTPSGTPEWCWVDSYPQQPGDKSNILYAVDGVATSDVWAVGEAAFTPLVEHYNGLGWSAATYPDSGKLRGVAALSASDVWAVGEAATTTLTMHWDGAKWSVVPGPSGAMGGVLTSVSGVASNDVWAVGLYSPGSQFETLTMHWDGTAWSIVPSPSPGMNDELSGVTAISANDVWAVGDTSSGSGSATTLAMHWDGTAWSVVSTPNLGDINTLNAVDAVASNDVWAAGSSYITVTNTGSTLLLHWDGNQWTPQQSPQPAFYYPTNIFYGLEVPSHNSVWAAGVWHNMGSNRFHTLVANGYDNQWDVEPEPLPSGTDNTAYAIKIFPNGEGWVVGTYLGRTPGLKAMALHRVASDHSFSDVFPTDYFYQAVQYLTCHNVISGYSDGTFRPYNNTTRGQMAKIVVIAEGYPIDTTGGPHFSDVPASNPFYQYIETAYNAGIVSGYADGTYRWGADVTRGQLCKIVVTAEGWAINTAGGPHFSDVPTTNPFYAFIETAYNHQVISGYADGTFRWGNNATRGQIAKIVFNTVTAP